MSIIRACAIICYNSFVKRNQKGFTIIELVFVIVLLIGAGIIFFIQSNASAVANRDQQRKTSINSMYYALEKVYYPANKSYPRVLSAETLTSVDPSVFTDPDGNIIGTSQSNYRYEAINCSGDVCTGYKLRSSLENEAEYVKSSPS